MAIDSSPTTRTIVAAISLVAIVVGGFFWVDEYKEICRNAELTESARGDWDIASVNASRFERIRTQVQSELTAAELGATSPDEIDAARDRFIEIVRTSGAKLRQMEVASRTERTWAIEGDNPRNAAMTNDGEPSKYQLHTYQLELRAEGSFEQVRNMMDLIATEPRMMSTNRFIITPSSGDRQNINIELTVTLYGLNERTINKSGSLTSL